MSVLPWSYFARGIRGTESSHGAALDIAYAAHGLIKMCRFTVSSCKEFYLFRVG